MQTLTEPDIVDKKNNMAQIDRPNQGKSHLSGKSGMSALSIP
jgi:hypothetical protein